MKVVGKRQVGGIILDFYVLSISMHLCVLGVCFPLTLLFSILPFYVVGQPSQQQQQQQQQKVLKDFFFFFPRRRSN